MTREVWSWYVYRIHQMHLFIRRIGEHPYVFFWQERGVQVFVLLFFFLPDQYWYILVAVMQNTKPRLFQVKCLSGTYTVPRVVHKTEDTASCFNPEQQLNSASPVICKLLEVILFEINNSYCWIENVFKEKNTLISAWKNCATEVF